MKAVQTELTSWEEDVFHGSGMETSAKDYPFISTVDRSIIRKVSTIESA